MGTAFIPGEGVGDSSPKEFSAAEILRMQTSVCNISSVCKMTVTRAF
jgi:hypothetical protein